MEAPTLYRRRLIPDECVELKDDVIIYQDGEMIITTWTTLRQKAKLTHGISCYFLKKNIKVSKFYDHERFKFYYCDIIQTEYDEETNTYTFIDLLTDVIFKPGSYVKVVDLDELSDAVERGLITQSELLVSLRNTNTLLEAIYSDEFFTQIARLNDLDPWDDREKS